MNATLGALPSPKSPRFQNTFSPVFNPISLTGAAAIADSKRSRDMRYNQDIGTSENPAKKALSALMAGGGAGMSRVHDAPSATTSMSEGMSTVAQSISIPSTMHFGDKGETSPASVTSLASLGSTAPTATASSTLVASPAAMTSEIEADARNKSSGTSQLHPPGNGQSSNRALSFPGNVLAEAGRLPPRGLSLPMAGLNQQIAPRSPSQKKHKCPYCETEFTRHHNLKSHLLTHSQEKPYLCQTCAMRFRRLHDLKRHTKLHTGERPHICPKCDRKFARGDALARHSKGQGGCAGRRASVGSFGENEDFEGSNAGDGEEGMDGVMYTNGSQHQNENEMSEEDRRRFSLPSIKAQHVPAGSGDSYTSHSRTPSTYPPAGPRPGQSSGGLYPPDTDRRGSSSSATSPNSNLGGHTPNTSISSIPLNTSGGSMFSQSGMTESPKPLSPGGMHSHQLGHDIGSINRQRSPSLTTQFQQAHFGRRQSSRSSPPVGPLSSPHGNSHVPKLPSISGLAPPDQRFTLSSQIPGQQVIMAGGQPISGATSPSVMFQPQGGLIPNRGPPGGMSHHQQNPMGDSSANLFAAGERGVWTYVQTLEDKVKQLSDKVQIMEGKEKISEIKIKQLSDQVMSLTQQLNPQNQQYLHSQHINAQNQQNQQQMHAQSHQLQSSQGHP